MAEENVDTILSQDLVNLDSYSDEDLKQLIELVIRFTIDSKGSELQSKMASFAESTRSNAGVLKSIVKSLILFFQRGMREGWSAEQLEISASGLGLPERIGLAMRESWELHSKELTSSLLSKIVSANQLVDVDWSFGVTASTDDCDKVGRTFLQMKLTVDRGEGLQNVYMELSLEQFYQFMVQMEKAKAYLDFVSG